jgi:hypothetical protein
VSHNQRKNAAGLWCSPAIRAARLGGLCIVAGVSLVAAGGLVASDPVPGAIWAAVALMALPALALGALALHRALHLRHG